MKHYFAAVFIGLFCSCVSMRSPIADTAQFKSNNPESLGFLAANVMIAEKIFPKNRGWNVHLKLVSTDGQKDQNLIFRKLRSTQVENSVIFSVPMGRYKIENVMVKLDRRVHGQVIEPERTLKQHLKTPISIEIKENKVSFLGDLRLKVYNYIDTNKGRRGTSYTWFEASVNSYTLYPKKSWQKHFENLKVTQVFEASTGKEMMPY